MEKEINVEKELLKAPEFARKSRSPCACSGCVAYSERATQYASLSVLAVLHALFIQGVKPKAELIKA